MGIDHSNPYIHSTTVLCDKLIRNRACVICHALANPSWPRHKPRHGEAKVPRWGVPPPPPALASSVSVHGSSVPMRMGAWFIYAMNPTLATNHDRVADKAVSGFMLKPHIHA